MTLGRKSLIFNIQKFSTHDGPGIRTTVFFKGCPLRCLWCHNPESQEYQQEHFLEENGEKTLVGKEYEIDELVNIVMKDQIFYDQSCGGVTLSGGEVMTQDMTFVEEFVKALYRRGISIAIDTCGFSDAKTFKRLLPYVDIWLYDLKILDSKKHELFTGKSNEIILENLKLLSEERAKIFLRLLVIEGVNSDLESFEKIYNWLKKNKVNIEELDILPYHDFGRNKYSKLDRECTQKFEVPDDEKIERIRSFFEEKGYRVKVGG